MCFMHMWIDRARHLQAACMTLCAVHRYSIDGSKLTDMPDRIRGVVAVKLFYNLERIKWQIVWCCQG